MNFVFTIVAKNYLPLAKALFWSLKNYNKTQLTFLVFLADNPDKLTFTENESLTIIPATDLGLDNLEEMAFQYNVTEFCTAIKPSCFKYVFKQFGAEKVVYFDPDIFVFNDLKPVFDDLINKDIVVTPHYLTPELDYTGDQDESVTLFVGIYNFGFLAVKRSDKSLFLIDWWESRLQNQSYADRQDALHTDQKWADFFNVYVTEELLVSRSLGYNVAPWNLFEREIIKSNGKLGIKNRFTKKTEDLIFVHFAGFDSSDLSRIHRYFPDMKIEKYPEYNLVRQIYINTLNQFESVDTKHSIYSYARFSNGYYIQDFQRRIFRALKEDGHKIEKPFDSDAWFYRQLDENRRRDEQRPGKLNRRNMENYERTKNRVNFLLKILHRIIGVNRYFLLMRFLNRYSRPENQTFLIGQDVKKEY